MYNHQNGVFIFDDAQTSLQSGIDCNESLTKTPARITQIIEEWAKSDLNAQELTYLKVTPKPWAMGRLLRTRSSSYKSLGLQRVRSGASMV